MTKYEFIASLEKQLLRLPKADRDDILSDYEAHFAQGIECGKTEEEVSRELGDPAELAAVYLENLPENAKGMPYIPAEEAQPAADASYAQPNAQYAQPNVQYTQPTYQQPVYEQPQKKKNDAGAIVAVVLISLFVAIPVAWTLLGVLFGIYGTTVGVGLAAVGLVISGGIVTASSVAIGIGLILLAGAFAALCVLGVHLAILATKGFIWLVKWYIDLCKKMIKGEM